MGRNLQSALLSAILGPPTPDEGVEPRAGGRRGEQMATRLERWSFHFAPPSWGRGPGVIRLLKRDSQVLVPSQAAYEPPTDLYEAEQELVVRLEIAGLKVDRVRTMIELRDDLLTITGDRGDPATGAPRHYEQMEIATGRFERTVRLPVPVDAAQARATYDDGFLVIRIPKSQPIPSQPCTVTVE
jgi:HSP20 family protein